MRGMRRWLLLPWSLAFNLRYLPLKQALRLPILLESIPVCKGKGKIELVGDVTRGMVILGGVLADFYRKNPVIFKNDGKVIFHSGVCIRGNAYISCAENATIEFKQDVKVNNGCRFIASKQIVLGTNCRVGWDCTFIDNDYHVLWDIVAGKACKSEIPVILGEGCWIGHDCVISKGTRLMDYTTVSSLSKVQLKNRKSNTIVSGNPAQVVDEGYRIKLD